MILLRIRYNIRATEDINEYVYKEFDNLNDLVKYIYKNDLFNCSTFDVFEEKVLVTRLEDPSVLEDAIERI